MLTFLKNALKIAAVSIAAIILMSVPFFVYAWYDHTKTVQVWVQESIEDFQEHDIMWTEFKPDDTEEALHQLRTVVTANTRVFRTRAIRLENTLYMDRIYDLINVLINEPDDTGDIIRGIFAAQSAQTNFYEAADKFLNSRLYAMRYTF